MCQALVASLLLVSSHALGFAQETGGTLEGSVTDGSGAGLPETSLVVTNLDTRAVRKLATDNRGRYAAPGLPVGRYEIEASKPGFASATRGPLDLAVGGQVQVDFTLKPGQVRQVVTVEETVISVGLNNESTSGLVTERQVKELPLNGRSYDGLMTLNPAVVNYTSQRSGGVGTSNSAVGNTDLEHSQSRVFADRMLFHW